jgi:hypothetical protein
MYRMGTPRLHGQAAEGAQRLSLNGPIRVLAHQPRLPILFLKPYQNRGLSEIIWLQAWICSDRAQRIFGTASSSGSDRTQRIFGTASQSGTGQEGRFPAKSGQGEGGFRVVPYHF